MLELNCRVGQFVDTVREARALSSPARAAAGLVSDPNQSIKSPGPSVRAVFGPLHSTRQFNSCIQFQRRASDPRTTISANVGCRGEELGPLLASRAAGCARAGGLVAG